MWVKYVSHVAYGTFIWNIYISCFFWILSFVEYKTKSTHRADDNRNIYSIQFTGSARWSNTFTKQLEISKNRFRASTVGAKIPKSFGPRVRSRPPSDQAAKPITRICALENYAYDLVAPWTMAHCFHFQFRNGGLNLLKLTYVHIWNEVKKNYKFLRISLTSPNLKQRALESRAFPI